MAKLRKYLTQPGNDLITNLPCAVTIGLSSYRLNDNLQIKENEGIIWVNSLLSQIEYSDIVFNLILDYPVELQIKEMEYVPKEKIVLTYGTGDLILTVPFSTVEIKQQVSFGERLLGGREVYKNPEHLLKRLMDVYGGKISDLDLVHLETLLSQAIRDRSHPELPARLGKKWDPIMMNIKSTVFNISFLQGLEFENMRKAIDTGLTTSEDIERSVLEKLATGELVETKRRGK
jgi:hypothetical protein